MMRKGGQTTQTTDAGSREGLERLERVDLAVAAVHGVRIGRFRCGTGHPLFRDSGPTRGWLVVFPRTSVWIAHAGRAPFVADPSLAVLYNAGQEYRREAVSAEGDRCEWFSFDPSAVAEAHAEGDASAADRVERPFAVASAPVDAATYALQRRVYEHVTRGESIDPLFVEEASLTLLRRVVAAAQRRERRGVAPQPLANHGALVDAVKETLASRLGERLSLGEIARAVGCSPFHLARVFQRATGSGVHAYRAQLRLRASLERVVAGEDLTAVALDLGFSSHSHFSTAFARAFGEPPRAFRGASKKMKAARRGVDPR
jgi:AraC-like DNA-binding protein